MQRKARECGGKPYAGLQGKNVVEKGWGGGRLRAGRGGGWAALGADHLVGGPEGDDLNVAVLVGDGVAVPQAVKVQHHSTAHPIPHIMHSTTWHTSDAKSQGRASLYTSLTPPH